MKRHHLAGLVGLLLPLPILAACGAEPAATSSDSVALEAPAAAAVAQEADGAAMVAELRTALEALTTTRFEVRLTGRLEATATGVADLTGKQPAVRLVPDTPLLGVGEVRLVEGVGYALVGGQWVRADLDRLLAMLPVDLTGLDVDVLADALAAALSDVEVSGDTGEEVWRGTVDPAALLAALADAGELGGYAVEDAGQAEVTATFRGDRLDTLVVDLGDTGSVELTLSGQGEPVRVTAPRGDVRDLTESGWFAYTPETPGG